MTTHIRILPFLSITVLAASTALAGVARHDRTLEYHRQLATQSQFQAAGGLTIQGVGFGSGTLIAPGWVLTAAHATELAPANRLHFTINGRSYTGAQTYEHPLWQGTSRITEGYDIALIRLEDAVEDVTPAQIYRGSEIVGRQAMLVGAGLIGYGDSGQIPGTTGTLHAGLNTIDATANQLGAILPGIPLSSNNLVIDFDSPDSSFLNRTGSSNPLDHEFFPGQGDSGGAYWIQDTDGQWKLASIQSWGTLNAVGDNFGQYGHMAISAKLYEQSVLSWIDSTVPAPSTLALLFPFTFAAARRSRILST